MKSVHRNLFISLVGLPLLLLLFSCDQNLVFEDYKNMPQTKWNASEVAKFNVPLAEKNIPYNFYINVRVQNDYGFANLFLFMKTLYPSGKISIDTVECFLADVDGRWLGNRSGNSIDNRILLRSKMKFEETGQYSFEFEQAMRDTVLAGIEDFGIRIEKAE
jgi:gliding motility-associated lipoprotein GldH